MVAVVSIFVLCTLLAALWVLLADGSYRARLGALLIGSAVLVCLAGGGSTVFSRIEDAHVRAFLGAGPERDDETVTSALGPLGMVLFVALPLFLLGGWLADAA